ncbi:glycoside hydrolase family 19 protein [Magnetospirillum moscoviense]|uniref:Glycoside hydrolase family 19 n=1 Tax=Magnetospirillum moscoviense TaxID=1437059 RepID=A0A178MPX7_9PROT|nr:glycoside hydrolase family 19 protein [Magnetospirillum moscoviense]OAN50699.1 glycoside hydrolase family 19 [Magnetospirillum moscoviense]
MLTVSILQAAVPAASAAAIHRLAEPLAQACTEFSIDSPARLAAFLAQVAHESGSLARLIENLNYSAQGLLAAWPKRFTPDLAAVYARQPVAIANRVYADRMGNGDEASGDGWRYRGRGMIQLTGRATYAACGSDLGLALVDQPDQLIEPAPAARSAAWFWHTRDLNALADAGDFDAITRRINGGLTGQTDRRKHHAHAMAALGLETMEV